MSQKVLKLAREVLSNTVILITGIIVGYVIRLVILNN